ncbi:FluG domain-containing protein [Triangularia setosa]|uniref:FluG domain-containing protein n=1 Tax=Triangularia setosa TaxID=2587417 RepID=A0AAN6VZK5_9PEZI|nr:FluG domain-containing protein [Podospora setosa]
MKQREAERQIAKRPKALTAEQRAALRKQLEDTKYCEFITSEEPWRDVIKTADRAMVMDVLDYLCQTCRIKSWGASWDVTGRYMDRNDSLEWHDAVLVRRYDLQPPCNRGKDVANVDTLLVLQTFDIKDDTGIFSWERHRIQLSGCYLGQPKLFTRHATGSPSCDKDKGPDEHSRLLEEMISQECESRGRPKALCYEDILLMVVRHPKTDEDALTMSIKFVHHKGADNKPKPTIFFFTPTRRLIFCFISVIVSLAVHDSAFAASKFTSARAVFQARNRGPIKCTPLRWKEEWLKRPVFRRHDDSKLHDDMERQSLDAGEENAIEPKAWRRGAANTANVLFYQCVGSASDAVRDQMMRHGPKWATFNSAYINEKVGFHLQNAFLDEPTEDGLLAMLSHIGVMRDPRASKDMVPDEVWELIPPDQQVAALKAERAKLKGGQYRIKLIAAKEAQRKKAIRQAYREDYFHNRPTWDIDTDGQEEDEYVKPAIDLHIPERAQLAQILCNQPKNLSSGELLELRIQAAELMVVLCGKRETMKRKRIQRRAQANIAVEESFGPDPFPLPLDRKQCPCCIGNETLSHGERTFKYSRPAVMYDHFDRKHGQQLGGCRGKALEFKHLNHFKNHVETVHGVKLRA